MYESLLTVLIIAVILGLDAFSLALGMSLKGVSRDFEFKFTGIVGILHILMPLVGLRLGMAAGKVLGIWAGRIGALILIYIAVDLLVKGFRQTRPQTVKFQEGRKELFPEPTLPEEGFKGSLVLGVSVSMDALTVGFSLGTFNMPIMLTSVIMGFVAGIMTFLGFWGGRAFSQLVGIYAQIIGGVILFALAIKLAI
ncbi:MAG: manganese efflux pump MntP family protein [Syntrophomonadaceae bacterium]|jgi:putative Mn2+ efflux pump MntP